MKAKEETKNQKGEKASCHMMKKASKPSSSTGCEGSPTPGGKISQTRLSRRKHWLTNLRGEGTKSGRKSKGEGPPWTRESEPAAKS